MKGELREGTMAVQVSAAQRQSIERQIVAREKIIDEYKSRPTTQIKIEDGDKETLAFIAQFQGETDEMWSRLGSDARHEGATLPVVVDAEALLADVDTFRSAFSPAAIERAGEDAKAEIEKQHGSLPEWLDEADVKAWTDRAVAKALRNKTEAKRQAAQSILSRLPKIEQAIDQAIADATVLKVPLPSDPLTAATARTGNLLERQELRMRYANRPLQEIVRLYQSSSDKEQPAIVAFLEDEYSAGWPTLTPNVDDASASKFAGLIQARREQRIPARLSELKRRVRDLGGDSSLGAFIRGALRMYAKS